MKTIQYSTQPGTQPVWLGDEASHFNALPNGANLKVASWSGAGSIVPSGSLVGRMAGSNDFTYIPPTATLSGGTFNSKNSTKLTAAAAIGDTVIKVGHTDGFIAGQNIVVGTNTGKIIASVNSETSQITLTTALGAAAAVGATVEYTTALPLAELALTMTEIPDITSNREFTLLRNGRLIYINFIPNYSSFSADVLATIKSLYQCVQGRA